MNAPPETEIAVRARTIASLFNSFDPSPFREKDIDAEVEAFLVGWVRELPANAPFTIVVYLPAEEVAKPRAAVIPRSLRALFRLSRAGRRAGPARTVPRRAALLAIGSRC